MNSSTPKRPIWFFYPGNTSQWPGMGKELMKFEVFRTAIEECAKALQPYGVNLKNMLFNQTEETYNTMLNSFTVVASISIALTDLLKSVNIHPDGIIGSSLGEIGCAYADGMITKEQAIVAAYGRGKAIDAHVVPGKMVQLLLSAEECEKLLTDGVYIACYLTQSVHAISGPLTEMDHFISTLEAKNITYRVVPFVRYPPHTPYIVPSVPEMLEFTRKVMPEIKPRTKRWLPSAVPEKDWNTNLGKYNSAEYHCHNPSNPVHLTNIFKRVPKNAIVIEVGPKGVLQRVIKKGIGSDDVFVTCLQTSDVDNVQFLLTALDNIAKAGVPVDFSALKE